MQDADEQRPGASGRRWEQRFRTARIRRHGPDAQPSVFEQAIARGIAGEEFLGAQLTALAQEMDLAVLHDLASPGSNANIDHLLVSAAGVTVVDAKTWSGRVSFGKDNLWQGRQSRHKSLEGVAGQVARVRSALDATGHADVPIDGLICMVNGNAGVPRDGLVRVGGVGVGTIPSVRRHAIREGNLSPEKVRLVQQALWQHFVVSGGGYPPMITPLPDHPVSILDKILEEAGADRRRQRVARKRRRIRRARAVAVATAAVAALTASASLGPPAHQPEPLTRSEVAAMLPQLRSLASRSAGRRVRLIRIKATTGRFSLRYGRGSRCRVHVDVERLTRATTARASGCRSRR